MTDIIMTLAWWYFWVTLAIMVVPLAATAVETYCKIRAAKAKKQKTKNGNNV